MAPAVVEVIKRRRERSNTAFEQLRKSGITISGEFVMNSLRTRVSPVMEQVIAIDSTRADATFDALFDLTLELGSIKSPGVDEVWQILPRFSKWIIVDARRIVGSLINAASQMEEKSGKWLDALAEVEASSLEELLELGKVCAWKIGLPQFRNVAIAAARKAERGHVANILEVTEDQVDAFLDQAERDPWMNESLGWIDPVGRLGNFRGLGGTFVRPPTVFEKGGRIFVTDREFTWRVEADRFGKALLRDRESMGATMVKTPFSLRDDGTIIWGEQRQRFIGLDEPTSLAWDGQTLAVTISRSHHVFLFSAKEVKS